MQTLATFPLFYLPPISYFSTLNSINFEFEIEKFEHFPKQTFRNRTVVSSPNGPLNLFIPVIKGSRYHTVIKDVRISYDFKWQRLHWLSFEACYRNSAYFEFYEDEFAELFHAKTEYLFDFNLALLEWILKKLKKTPKLHFTTEFFKEKAQGLDFRDHKHFKKSSDFQNKPYFQVFEDRNGFLPNMSIVDLLFNQGPQSKNFL
jgi:hypothetical protein